MVAFAKQAGVAALQDHVRRFLEDGQGVEAFVGIDALGTSREALSLLLELGVPTHVFHNPGHTFHPKLYLLEGEEAAFAIIGSSNLTLGGLYINYELGTGLRLNLTVEADAATHAHLKGVVDSLRGSINTRDLTNELLEELSNRGLLGIEARPDEEAEAEAEASRRARQQPGAALFEQTPVPPPPRFTRPAPAQSQPAELQALLGLVTAAAQFVMVLGTRDAQTQRGFSPDIFIPIAARNAEPAFWRWPESYVRHSPNGTYDERRVAILVRTEQGASLVRGVRNYFYHERAEFRLNCSELVSQASAGDLLVLELPAEPIPDVDYIGSVVPQTSPLFQVYSAIAANTVRKSTKRWGYS